MTILDADLKILDTFQNSVVDVLKKHKLAVHRVAGLIHPDTDKLQVVIESGDRMILVEMDLVYAKRLLNNKPYIGESPDIADLTKAVARKLWKDAINECIITGLCRTI